MKRKILGFLVCGVIMISLTTGCGSNEVSKGDTKENTTSEKEEIKISVGDNKELEDALNNYVEEKKVSWEEQGYASYLCIGHFIDDFDQYTFIALCDKEFASKPNITGYTSENWTSEASNIENYDGECTYNTVELENERNKDRTYHTLVMENSTENYYDVYITFKTIKIGDKTYCYPVFSDSKLLK
mgnify:CR=1 FL=1